MVYKFVILTTNKLKITYFLVKSVKINFSLYFLNIPKYRNSTRN